MKNLRKIQNGHNNWITQEWFAECYAPFLASIGRADLINLSGLQMSWRRLEKHMEQTLASIRCDLQAPYYWRMSQACEDEQATTARPAPAGEKEDG